MFKIGSGRFAWIPVAWPGLLEDGSPVDNEIEMQVELVGRTELKEQLRAEREDGADPFDFAKKVTRNWRGVGDKDGEPLAFDADNFALLFETPGFASGFGTAYMTAWQGISGIREKNSATSPADGQAAGGASPKPAA